ncbi:response regulator transcription factor [Arthrobacter sp. MPF02]|uniref:response regulator transcription factor n=1 Tax=Arthrobacter sp. MPF02 TaxID=3388492 RepID=UPI0039852997
METRTVVIVEDAADVRDALTLIFRQAGFRVHAVGSGAEGVRAVRDHQPQAMILDIELPDIDGYEVARRVRLFSNTYILMLTARAQELDILLGLEAGADDYVSKPFRLREIRYRVEALLRRPRIRSDTPDLTASPLQDAESIESSQFTPAMAEQRTPRLEHNGLRMNLPARTVEVDGTEVRLTASEFDLLRALLESGRTVRAKEDLAAVLRGGQGGNDGFGRESDEQVVQVHIANLRKKLGDSAADPRWVETVHGFGYRLAAAKAVAPAVGH